MAKDKYEDNSITLQQFSSKNSDANHHYSKTNHAFQNDDENTQKDQTQHTKSSHDKNEQCSGEKSDFQTKSAEEIKQLNFVIWKSVLSMGVVFMLIYTSYGGLFSISSSLHIQEGMGTICASVRYVANVVSALFLPKLMITYLAHKWTVCVSLLGFIVWMVANGYGVWATMIPASIINGLFVAPLWAAQGAYYTGWLVFIWCKIIDS